MEYVPWQLAHGRPDRCTRCFRCCEDGSLSKICAPRWLAPTQKWEHSTFAQCQKGLLTKRHTTSTLHTNTDRGNASPEKGSMSRSFDLTVDADHFPARRASCLIGGVPS